MADGLWIGPLDGEFVEAVMNACEVAGENFRPVRQFGSRYSVVREDAPAAENKLIWDPDRRIKLVVQLSRLIHATSICYEYAARIEQRGPTDRRIIPMRPRGAGADAHVARPDGDRMTNLHVPLIAGLIREYDHDTLPERVKSVLFYFEYAAWTYYVDIRWPMLVTAAESLIHIEGERDPGSSRYAGSTRVFVERMLGIQERVGAFTFTPDNLRTVYRERSGFAHGQGFEALDEARREHYLILEDGLQRILRSAVLDPAFARLFVNAETIQRELPLARRSKS